MFVYAARTALRLTSCFLCADIPLPTTMHVEWVVKAAAAGKHVLVEKPDAVSEQELATMLAACAEHNVQFMDCVMWMHNSRNAPLKRGVYEQDRKERRCLR
eukprot:SAG22_NODE_5285_length_1045_cov_1.567653_2_plen_101_part_00